MDMAAIFRKNTFNKNISDQLYCVKELKVKKEALRQSFNFEWDRAFQGLGEGAEAGRAMAAW